MDSFSSILALPLFAFEMYLHRMIKLKIADLFTLGNLAAGFISILTDDIHLAAGLIMLGASFDVLDGLIARAMNQQSELGKQLDSLADVVTFGVAPATLFFQLLPEGLLSTIVCTLIPLFSAWRLAMFNLLPSQPHFIGLPTPANALWYVGLALWMSNPPEFLEYVPTTSVLMILSVILSVLMVSSITFPSLKSRETLSRNKRVFLAGLAGLVLAVLCGQLNMAINGFLFFFILASCIPSWTRRPTEFN